jgi:hypothetical protein
MQRPGPRSRLRATHADHSPRYTLTPLSASCCPFEFIYLPPKDASISSSLSLSRWITDDCRYGDCVCASAFSGQAFHLNLRLFRFVFAQFFLFARLSAALSVVQIASKISIKRHIERASWALIYDTNGFFCLSVSPRRSETLRDRKERHFKPKHLGSVVTSFLFA